MTHTAGHIALSSQRDCRAKYHEQSSPRSKTMKTRSVNGLSGGSVVSQLALILAAAHNRQRALRVPSKKLDVTPVYKRTNFAGKLQSPAIFGDAQRAFQAAIQAQHVVAAT
jgi:hypothetical protein